MKYNDTHAHAITTNRRETREREEATEQRPELSVGAILEGMMKQRILCRYDFHQRQNHHCTKKRRKQADTKISNRIDNTRKNQSWMQGVATQMLVR